MTGFRERPEWREPVRHRSVELDPGFSGVLDPADVAPLRHPERGPRHADQRLGRVPDSGPATTPIPRVRVTRGPAAIPGSAEDTLPAYRVPRPTVGDRGRPAEREHRGRDTYVVHTEDVFGDTQFVAPPVIGE
jgi:hypothetical protein